MAESAGIQLGLLNIFIWILAIILVVGKIYGPPWKWGKKNPGRNNRVPVNSGSVILKAEQMPGLAPQCRKNSEKLVRICTEVKDLTGDVERYSRDTDRKIEKLSDKIDQNNSKLHNRIDLLRDKIH